MRKRILYIAKSLEIGGLERVIVLLNNNLDRERFEPYICCVSTAGELAKGLDSRNRLLVMGNKGRISPGGFRYIFSLIREKSIDLVHSHELAALLYGLPCAKLAGIPIIHTKHGYGGIVQERRSVGLIGKWFSRSVSEYVCVSKELKERMKGEIGIADKKLSVIYNGIDPSDFSVRGSRTGEEIVIGSVGRLNRVKNYPLLIKAFNEIQKRYPKCRLEIVGGGKIERELEELVESMSLSDKVRIHGYQLDVSSFLRRFDIFVLASVYEGLSMSLLEAISAGLPCVVTNVGGNTEIIEDGINGFVFRSEDQNGLINKMSHVIENLQSFGMENIREKARETFRAKFSVEKMIERHQDMYERHLSAP